MTLAIWLMGLLTAITVWTVIDTRQYRRFREESHTAARLAFYWRWAGQSFVFLTLASLLTLWLLDRMDAIRTLPPEFLALRPPASPEEAGGRRSADAQLGMALGMLMSTAFAVFIWTRRIKQVMTPVVGDIEPLIPRNTAERWAALVLSVNAGYSEEFFFRLALPLLLTTVTGSAAVGLGVSVVIFGGIHWYQGWKGVLATMLVGGLLTLVYLTSGSLLRVMFTHALIDVVGLVLRPLLAQQMARRVVRG